MNYDSPYRQTEFSKALLTGLFAGLMSTLICLVYGFFYRLDTGFTLSEIINVPSIIISCHLLLIVCGLVFYAFKKYFKSNGSILFSVVFAAITAFCIWKADGVERSPIHQVTIQFRGLLIGMVAIMGIMASFGIPFFFSNKKIAEQVI